MHSAESQDHVIERGEAAGRLLEHRPPADHGARRELEALEEAGRAARARVGR